MKYIPRIIEEDLKTWVQSPSFPKNVILLSGPRQVGKTTCIEEFSRSQNLQLTSLNFEEEPSAIAKIEECSDFSEFKNLMEETYHYKPSQKSLLFFDESQHCKKLVQFIRFMKEKWPMAQVIVSGSNISEILDSKARYPVGRITPLSLGSLSFKEFLISAEQDSLVEFLRTYILGKAISPSIHHRLLSWLEKYLVIGGLPEVVKAFLQGENWQRVQENLLQSYRLDFVRYFSVEKENLFSRTLKAVASCVGSSSKDSHVVESNRPGYRDVPEIYSRLEKWEMVLKVEQLGLQPEKNHFYPKRYLFDIGLLHHLRMRTRPEIKLMDQDRPDLRQALGGILENFAALFLKRQSLKELTGLRLAKNVEIDFLLALSSQSLAIEIKSALKSKQTHVRSLEMACEKLRLPHGILFNLSLPREFFLKAYKIYTLPLYLAEEISRLF